MRDNYQNDEFLRRRAERQKRIKKRRAKIVTVVILLLLLVVGAILSVTVLFPIKNIDVSGSKMYTESQILEACSVKTGDNLIVASKEKALSSLKAKLPFVDKVEFEREFPDTLKIKITDAKEFVCYKVGDKYYTVSQNGWVLKSYAKKPNGVMLVICDKIKCKVGSSVNFTDKSLSELCNSITESLKKQKLSVEYIDLSNKMSIVAKVDGRFIVNFGSNKDFESKVKHLVAMMKEISETATGEIDLSMWSSQNTQGAFVKSEIK